MTLDGPKKEEQLAANPLKGSNQSAIGSYNERLVLHLVRDHGALTKAEATRATGLSANAISAIFRTLEKRQLLQRGAPIRGRIGQPSVPLSINPSAHHYLTLKIGRRSLELAVVNFGGEILSSEAMLLPFPTPDAMLGFVRATIGPVLKRAGQSPDTISGMGVAMPYELWSWSNEFGAPPDEMRAWKAFDATRVFSDLVPCDVVVENDATAACRAELIFGAHPEKQDWIYFYVGTFIGGGIVLNGSAFPGRRGNAGGFGPMRVPDQDGGNRLVDHASLVVLERAVAEHGGDPFALYDKAADWARFEPDVAAWIKRAGRNLAHAAVSSLSLLDFADIVVDGAFPDSIRTRLTAELRTQLGETDLQGIVQPTIHEGGLGRRARTIGAAAAVISRDYAVEWTQPLRG